LSRTRRTRIPIAFRTASGVTDPIIKMEIRAATASKIGAMHLSLAICRGWVGLLAVRGWFRLVGYRYRLGIRCMVAYFDEE
jgi:hypothetical protein